MFRLGYLNRRVAFVPAFPQIKVDNARKVFFTDQEFSAFHAALLDLTGGTLNVYTKIGLVTLLGLITKHGILIVEFANQLREQGRDKRQAVIESAVLRLRPILMTTGAMILGAIPLALATGAGAESRQQIGWVIVGGMAFGTLFTLFVVPTFYTLFAGRRPALAAAEKERRHVADEADLAGAAGE